MSGIMPTTAGDISSRDTATVTLAPIDTTNATTLPSPPQDTQTHGLRAFDPLSVSPTSSAAPTGVIAAASSDVSHVAGANHLLDHSPTHILSVPVSVASTGATHRGHTTSVSSYSSAALSSGSFTAISVSPVPSELPLPTPQMHTAGHGAASNTPGTSSLGDFFSLGPSVATTAAAVTTGGDTTTGSAAVRQAIAQIAIASPGSSTSQHFGAAETVPEGDERAVASAQPASSSTQPAALPATADGLTTSPSYPQIPTSSSTSTSLSVSRPESPGPLPPVVSALMAAQKVAGCAPGATLAIPSPSQAGRLLFICGDASGAGKSCVAMGLLHLLLKRGYEPRDLAYIKPVTQCTDVQIISKYCESKGIAHQGLGPVIFYEGFTAAVIDGKTESIDARRARIQKAVNKIADGKKWVLVDGVGYAAVGSVAGVSNAEVASLLNAPVLVIGRPGIGNAIDAMNFMLAYFEKFHVHTLGACWNKVPPMHSYHSYENSKSYVNKYFRQVRSGLISTYGHIPLVEKPAAAPAADGSEPVVEVSCRLRPAKTELVMTEAEEAFARDFFAIMEREFDIELLLADLNRYHAHRVQLVSVV